MVLARYLEYVPAGRLSRDHPGAIYRIYNIAKFSSS
eukprot:SAG31_NODE_2615_length_5371_cov_89.477238_6_plen_36_part_00